MRRQLQSYEVLLRRAECNTQQLTSLQSTYHTQLAGFNGEKRVLFELKEIPFPHSVIHNYFAKNQFGHTVQIDIIFICAHFVMILEVKNISGRIDFDDSRRQLIRTRTDGQQESFLNPVDQVKRHQHYIESLLVQESHLIPVESAIVIANPSTLIGHISSEVPVFNVSGLRSKILELSKKYAHVSFNMRHVLGILKKHNLERHFTLPVINFPIRMGVLCLHCGERMVFISHGFKCTKCNCWDVDNEALKKTLLDYKTLYGNEITNAKFRQFTGIQNRTTAYKYLLKLGLPFRGNNRGRVYLLNKLE